MTPTPVPTTRPENPGKKAPGEDTDRLPVDKIAPPGPGVGKPDEEPTDPNRSETPAGEAPRKDDAQATGQS